MHSMKRLRMKNLRSSSSYKGNAEQQCGTFGNILMEFAAQTIMKEYLFAHLSFIEYALLLQDAKKGCLLRKTWDLG